MSKSGDMSVSQFYNRNDSSRVGIEFSMAQYFEYFNFSQTLIFVDSLFDSGINSGRMVPFVSPVTANIQGTYQPFDFLKINISGKYKESFYVDEGNLHPKTEPAILCDLYVNYISDFGMILSAGVNNFLNTEYYSDINHDTTNNTVSYIPGDEITFYMNISYRY